MDYIKLLKHELIPAFGCTEPIALALASSMARKVLKENPNKIVATLSGNMIKNANSVKVPGTDGRKGIEISLVAGAFLGNSDKGLEVLEGIDKSKLSYCDKLIEDGIVEIKIKKNCPNLYIDVYMVGEYDSSRVVLEHSHTNVVLIERNGESIKNNQSDDFEEHEEILTFNGIYDFAKNGDYNEVKEILDMQLDYNKAIAVEGIENSWGSNIGKTILDRNSNVYDEKLVAYAAAGSDARMSGCEKPVVINSGSGNQGITVSVPLGLYLEDNNIDGDLKYRSLIFANLIGLYIKQGIGKLSAYCGVVSAAAASVCGIAFAKEESKEIIEKTLTNALATNSGIICDGAKPSCASKIASSLRNAFLSYDQAKTENSFISGDGIVKDSVEETVKTVGNIARNGMKSTDEVILNEMIKK